MEARSVLCGLFDFVMSYGGVLDFISTRQEDKGVLDVRWESMLASCLLYSVLASRNETSLGCLDLGICHYSVRCP